MPPCPQAPLSHQAPLGVLLADHTWPESLPRIPGEAMDSLRFYQQNGPKQGKLGLVAKENGDPLDMSKVPS